MPLMTAADLLAQSDPEHIEARSFALIDQELPPPRPFQGELWTIARRCIHTSGDVGLVPQLRLSEWALERGKDALLHGRPIFTDTNMAREAITARRMRALGVTVRSIMELPDLDRLARQAHTTRAQAGIVALHHALEGAIVVIGNAPTALLALLDALDHGAPWPALIVGMPVGFVHAEQSKELLHHSPYPHLTLLGRRGGSALAAACVNGLAELVLTNQQAARVKP